MRSTPEFLRKKRKQFASQQLSKILTKERIRKFLNRVEKRGDNECWPWKGAKTPKGYGKTCYSYVLYYTHRIAYQIANWDLQDSQIVAHSCDNPQCCNPAHLTATTQAANIQDMMAKGRRFTIRLHGEKNPACRLTKEQVVAIRSLYHPGQSQFSEIAKLFNVSPSSVANIIKRKTWNSVQ